MNTSYQRVSLEKQKNEVHFIQSSQRANKLYGGVTSKATATHTRVKGLELAGERSDNF